MGAGKKAVTRSFSVNSMPRPGYCFTTFARISAAFFDAATKDKAAFERLSDGKNRPWEAVTNADYDKTIELIKFVDSIRKNKS